MRRTGPAQLRLAIVLLALLLGGSRVVHAGHPYEHERADDVTGEGCEICAQLTKPGVLDGATAPAASAAAAPRLLPAPVRVDFRRAPPRPPGRGPPTHL